MTENWNLSWARTLQIEVLLLSSFLSSLSSDTIFLLFVCFHKRYAYIVAENPFACLAAVTSGRMANVCPYFAYTVIAPSTYSSSRVCVDARSACTAILGSIPLHSDAIASDAVPLPSRQLSR